MERPEGCIAFVTGTGRGIGSAIAAVVSTELQQDKVKLAGGRTIRSRIGVRNVRLIIEASDTHPEPAVNRREEQLSW